MTQWIVLQVSYIPDMDEQLPVPVEALQGYPLAYARALQPRRVDGTRCMTLLVRREALMAVSGAFQEAELGPEYSCVDLALRLQEKGNQVGTGLCLTILSQLHNHDLLHSTELARVHDVGMMGYMQGNAASVLLGIQ